MIRTSNLTYRYPSMPLMAFPDFSVEVGHPLLICGESGCGKSTLLHLLAGLKRPTNGRVLIGEKVISDFSSANMDRFRGQNIGIVFQHSYFVESLSIWDNLMISPYALDKKKSEAIINRLDINNLESRYPNQLSVGQQQRANIARAVMNRPKLLLADEPTSALDNKNCSRVINLLLEEANENEAALIIVTHDDRIRSEISTCLELATFDNSKN